MSIKIPSSPLKNLKVAWNSPSDVSILLDGKRVEGVQELDIFLKPYSNPVARFTVELEMVEFNSPDTLILENKSYISLDTRLLEKSKKKKINPRKFIDIMRTIPEIPEDDDGYEDVPF